MEFLFELLFELFGEVLLQVLGELLAEWGVHLTRPAERRRPPHPLFTLLGYALLGLAVGALSLLWLPHSLLPSKGLRLANLVLSPLLSGAVLAWIGHWRAQRGSPVPVRNRFMQGLVFAFAMAAVRYGATL